MGLTDADIMASRGKLVLVAASISKQSVFPLYTVRLFQCYMLDKSICHFRGTWSILLLLFYFSWKKPVSKHCGP